MSALPLISLIKKEFRQIFRNEFLPKIIFVMPILQVLLLGYAVTMDIKNIPTLLVDQDQSASSRELLQHFKTGGFFNVKGTRYELREVRPRLDSGDIALAVVIPTDFERKLERRETPQVQLLVDGQNANTAQIAMGYASRMIQEFSTAKLSPAMISQVRLIDVETRHAFNPNLESRFFYIPGVITILVMVITMALAALSIVSERERGTLEQLMVTPLSAFHFTIGKLVPFVVLGLLSSALALTFSVFWFHLPIRGDLWTLLLFTGVYLLSSLGLGILLSAFSQTQQQAMFLAWFFMITLMMMSGFFAPLENAPPVIEMISRINPLRYYILVIRELLIKGTPFVLLMNEFWILLGLGFSILGAGILMQKKRIS